MHTVEAWKRVADEYNTMGETLKREGLKLAFHSHTGEYVDVGSGKTGLDVFIANTKPTLLTSQMDLGWARVASQDPVAWSTKYPGPFRMWHVKDFENLKAAQDRETITLTNAAKEQPRSPVAPGNATTAARGARNAAGSPPAAPLSGRR
jgi:sugar phosphate isomerase/epimerase